MIVTLDRPAQMYSPLASVVAYGCAGQDAVARQGPRLQFRCGHPEAGPPIDYHKKRTDPQMRPALCVRHSSACGKMAGCG